MSQLLTSRNDEHKKVLTVSDIELMIDNTGEPLSLDTDASQSGVNRYGYSQGDMGWNWGLAARVRQ